MLTNTGEIYFINTQYDFVFYDSIQRTWGWYSNKKSKYFCKVIKNYLKTT